MSESHSGTVYYKKARFLTHLPEGRLYTRSHFWLLEVSLAVWRVGMTKFASRMLGDVVEFGFNVKSGALVEIGQNMGWIEGFKAVSDIYCVAAGEFLRANPALDSDITLLDSKPYGDGWLYEVRGVPEPESVDVAGYVALLDATIGKMIEGRHDAETHD
jgi:glycine cleavage system H protein